MDSRGKVVMESILETKASTILEFFAGLRGTLSVTFEEGTWAAWLYDLLKPHVAKVVVCNPRKNALLKDGNKSDRIDARKLAELLRLDNLKPVYHGETGVRMLRELARSYLTIVKDLSRVMNRLKALYRSWAIPCAGRAVYYTRHRAEWLGKIREARVRSWPEQGPQPGIDRSGQSCRDPSECTALTFAGLQPGIAGERHQDDDGASRAAPQDCTHYADSVEEGRTLRRDETKLASRVSVSA